MEVPIHFLWIILRDDGMWRLQGYGQPTDSEQQPNRRNEMPQQAPTRGDVTVIIHKSDNSDQSACASNNQKHRGRHQPCEQKQ
jgi:hypothetical protein